MVRLRSSKVEGKEELEGAFNPGRPWHLKKSEVGQRADVVGLVMPNALATTPLICVMRALGKATTAVTTKDRGSGTNGTCR
jgi:hypothetical protein